MRRFPVLFALGLATIAVPPAVAGDDPNPVPITRPEVKQTLEGSKQSHPRLPLPPLSDEEKARRDQTRAGLEKGVFAGVVNNGRMRN